MGSGFFKYWLAQRARGFWLSIGPPNGFGGLSVFKYCLAQRVWGAVGFLSTASPNGSGGAVGFFKYWLAQWVWGRGSFFFACLSSATASAWPSTQRRTGLAPQTSKLLQLEVIHIDLGCYESVTPNGCDKFITTQTGCSQTATPQNSPQSMRVWPGLRLIRAGGKIPKGVFVAVAEVEPDGVRLDNGMRLKNQELLRATRPSLRQLPGPHPPQPRPPGPGVVPPHAAPPVRGRLKGDELRAAGGGLAERAARRLQGLQHEVAHLKEHAPLPAHQPHVPGLHKRAALATRELCGARHGCRPGPRRGSAPSQSCT